MMMPLPTDSRLERSVLYYAVQVAIAPWLIFGAKGFSKLFWPTHAKERWFFDHASLTMDYEF